MDLGGRSECCSGWCERLRVASESAIFRVAVSRIPIAVADRFHRKRKYSFGSDQRKHSAKRIWSRYAIGDADCNTASPFSLRVQSHGTSAIGLAFVLGLCKRGRRWSAIPSVGDPQPAIPGDESAIRPRTLCSLIMAVHDFASVSRKQRVLQNLRSIESFIIRTACASSIACIFSCRGVIRTGEA